MHESAPASAFGAKLRQMRRERHLTQTQVATALGITQRDFSSLERFHAQPSRELLPRLARVLGVTSLDLIGE